MIRLWNHIKSSSNGYNKKKFFLNHLDKCILAWKIGSKYGKNQVDTLWLFLTVADWKSGQCGNCHLDHPDFKTLSQEIKEKSLNFIEGKIRWKTEF